GFDVLRAHSLRYLGPSLLIASSRYRLNVPIVAHRHHLDRNWLNPLIEGRVMRAVERVVVGSEFATRQAAAELGVAREKFSVVPYGVDRRFRHAAKTAALVARHGLSGKVVALFLGGLKERKNLFFLLDVWREVARAREDARLVVAGSGPLLGRLKRHTAKVGLEGRVVFAGYVPEHAKVDYYNLADLLLFPSAMEGFGLTVAEAMSCELPVVVSDRGSLPELVVDGEGGLLVGPSDRAACVRKTLLLCADVILRRKFGAASGERVERRYRWDPCAAATARVHAYALERGRPGPEGRAGVRPGPGAVVCIPRRELGHGALPQRDRAPPRPPRGTPRDPARARAVGAPAGLRREPRYRMAAQAARCRALRVLR